MSAASVDPLFMTRVLSCVHQEARSGANAATDYGIAVQGGMGNPREVIGWSVIVFTEAEYEADPEGVTDDQILAAVQAAWPTTWPPGMQTSPTLPAPRATSASAGAPGQFLPAGSSVPPIFPDVYGVMAVPETAWATGESVRLGDGNQVYWDGNQWVLGMAP